MGVEDRARVVLTKASSLATSGLFRPDQHTVIGVVGHRLSEGCSNVQFSACYAMTEGRRACPEAQL